MDSPCRSPGLNPTIWRRCATWPRGGEKSSPASIRRPARESLPTTPFPIPRHLRHWSGIYYHPIAVTEGATMVGPVDRYEELLRAGARRLTGLPRRLFQAEVCLALCDGSPRQAERRFGWGRETLEKGLHEYHS